MRRLVEIHRGERIPVALAAIAAFMSELSEAYTASCGDALYLGRHGAGGLGALLAVSAVTLALTLATVGAIADRWPRERILAAVGGLGCLVLIGLRVALGVWPAEVPALVVVLAKQLSAALDLAIWVLVADRFDARQGRRVVPLVVAAGGVGLLCGAWTTEVVVSHIGVEDLLLLGAAGAAAAGIAGGFLRGPAAPARAATRVLAALRDGARATTRNELARRLALLVTVAGAFGPVIYTALGAAAGSALHGEADLAGFFGKYRGLTSIATLLVQATIAPFLLRALGVGRSFLVAPLVALATGAALCLDAGILVAALASAGTRVVDSAVETPAEKLAQNLLPRGQRGRIAGFLEGVAKRAGALAGGLAITLVITLPRGVGLCTLAAGAAWLAVALALRRRYPRLAVDALAARRPSDAASETTRLDEADLRRLAADLAGPDDRRRSLAIEVLHRHAPGRAVPLLLAAARASTAGRSALILALDRVLELDPSGSLAPEGAAAQILAFLDESTAPLERASLVQAWGRLAGDARLDPERLADLITDAEPAVALAAQCLHARRHAAGTVDDVLARGRKTARDAAAMALLGAGHRPASVAALRAILVEELRAEALAGRAFAVTALAGLAEAGDEAERMAALAALGDAARRAAEHHPAIRDAAQAILDDVETPPPVRAAALAVLGSLGDVRLAPTLARALAARDDDVRAAAVAGLAGLGVAALPALLTAARFGRRVARDAALDLVGELSASPAALDELVDVELRALRETALHRHALDTTAAGSPAGRLLLARLDERAGEIARTLLLVVQARVPASAAAVKRALAGGGARDGRARAQALEALDAVLPRDLALRVIPDLDDAPAEDRAAHAAEALGIDPPAPDAVIRAELAGGDAVARLILVRAVAGGALAAHRSSLTDAAGASVGEADPMDLLRRIHTPDEEADVPGVVEAMALLREIPLFAELGPSQLAALAEAIAWETHAAGDELPAVDGVVVVHAGRLRVNAGVGEEDLGPGQSYGGGSLFGAAPAPTAVAGEKSRVIRLDRADFEQVVEDNPAIALAICRVLARSPSRI